MNGYLLDVNVLIALMDPLHVHHDAAHMWFASLNGERWATCATTQNAVVRIFSNPAYPTTDMSPQEAIIHLDRFLSNVEGHSFWSTSISLLDDRVFDRAYIQGHRQITDIFLAGIAYVQDGRLATFDRTIPISVVRGAEKSLIRIIPA